MFPAGQTQVAVQLDQVLTTLQADVRADLQILLDEFGNALDKHGGSEGLRELFEQHQRDGTVTFPYQTLVFFARPAEAV